jgi:hypothetical protein
LHKEWLNELSEELEFLKFKALQPQGRVEYERIEANIASIVRYTRTRVNAIPGPKPTSLTIAIATSMKKEAAKRQEQVVAQPKRQGVRRLFGTRGWI